MSFKQEKILNFEKNFVFNSIAEHLFLVYQQEPEPPLGSGSSQKRADSMMRILWIQIGINPLSMAVSTGLAQLFLIHSSLMSY